MPTLTNLIGDFGNLAETTYYVSGDEKATILRSSVHYKYGSYAMRFVATAQTEVTYTLRDASGAITPTLNPQHLYYVRVETYQSTQVGSADIYWPIAEPPMVSGVAGAAGQWVTVSAVVGRSSFTAGKYAMRLDFNNNGSSGDMWFDGLMLIDLTAAYGAGYEPTKAWCDANLPFFTATYIAPDPLPIAPTNLRQTGCADSTVSLAWDAMPWASGYKVYRDGILVTTVTDTVCNVSNTPYKNSLYAIMSYNSTGDGGTSDITVFVTMSGNNINYLDYPILSLVDGVAYGSTIQYGSPTPDTPKSLVDSIVSCTYRYEINNNYYKVSLPTMRSVGDVCDTWDASTGTFTQNIGVKIFDGTDTWGGRAAITTDPDCLSYFINKFGRTGSNAAVQAVSNMFLGVPRDTAAVVTGENIGVSATGALWITLLRSRMPVESSAGLNTWLAAQYTVGTPVIMYYQLATPVVSTIAPKLVRTPLGMTRQQIDIDLLKQSDKAIYIRFGLLNYQMKTVDVIEGQLTKESYTFDADSDIRRTFNLDMIVKDKIFTYTRTSSFWLDKYIQISVGYYSNRDKETYWYPMGIYLISESEYSYDGSNSNLSLSLVDLMSKLNGIRAGALLGTETVIPIGSNVRDVVISTIALGGFTKYRVEDPEMEVPYEITVGTGSSIYDLLCELRDLKPSWEFFFDTDGTFVFQPIPQCIEDSEILDDSILSELITSETLNRTDNEAKNHIIVYGASIDADWYSNTTTNSEATYLLTVDSYTSAYGNGDTFCLKANVNNLANPRINVNNLGAKALMNTVDGVDVALSAGTMIADNYYVIKYDSTEDCFYYKGQFQIVGEAKDTNELSPFYINGTFGDVVKVLSGDTYAKISTDELAQERAEYELWKATRFNETVTLNIVAIPFLEVNKKIGHVSLNTGEDMPLIIKKISGSLLEGTQVLECIHWYPLYPFST